MFVKANGIDIYYEKYGKGRPLLMVHGNSEDHTIFEEAMMALMDDFTVYTVDSRDHGLTTKTAELHYDVMADDMIAFMEVLDLNDVVFYGFSDGGIIGLIAAQKTDRIGMLITSGANISPQGVKLPFRILVRGMHFFGRNPKTELMIREPNIDPADLGKIKVPTFVLAGEKDLVLESETFTIANSIPGAQLRILPGEGHGSYIVHKTKIADIIKECCGIGQN